MEPLQVLFGAAVLCAGLSAWVGSRTALALLASTAFTFGLTLAGAPFVPLAWMAVDLLVVAVILWRWPHIPTADCFVLALFVPSWSLYFVESDAAYAASVLVCSAQMMLTFPSQRVCQGGRTLARKLIRSRFFDQRVSHA